MTAQAPATQVVQPLPPRGVRLHPPFLPTNAAETAGPRVGGPERSAAVVRLKALGTGKAAPPHQREP